MKRAQISIILVFILLSVFTSCEFKGSRQLAQDDPFDEVYGTSGGKKVRAAYKGIEEYYKTMSEQAKKAFLDRTKKEFLGDNPLSPLPRVLTEDEYEFLARGVEQRGRALREFLKDHYSGKKKYIKEGIFNQRIIDRIIARSHETEWEKYLDPETMNFWYGPDIIRGPPEKGFPEGRFYVVEDNPSFIGGMGDLLQARKSLFDNAPEYAEIIDSPDPNNFYNRMFQSYKMRAKKYGGAAVALQYVHTMAADNEDMRTREMMEKKGIEVVQFNPYEPKKYHDGKRVVADQDGVWIQYKGKSERKKIGYLIGNADPADLDLTHPAAYEYHLVDEATYILDELKPKAKQKQELLNALLPNPETGRLDLVRLKAAIKNSGTDHFMDFQFGIKGLFDALSRKKLAMTNPPGLDFIGDKEFYMYVEKLIEFYLGEKPLLKNIPSQSFGIITQDGRSIVNMIEFKKVFDNLDKFVIKGVDGRGGDAVWIGPKMKSEDIEKVKKMIKENPGRYKFQEFKPLSTLDEYIGDIRLISDVGPNKVIAADVPWARVVGRGGDGKVNISANGSEAAVLVRKGIKSKSCHILMKLLMAR